MDVKPFPVQLLVFGNSKMPIEELRAMTMAQVGDAYRLTNFSDIFLDGLRWSMLIEGMKTTHGNIGDTQNVGYLLYIAGDSFETPISPNDILERGALPPFVLLGSTVKHSVSKHQCRGEDWPEFFYKISS